MTYKWSEIMADASTYDEIYREGGYEGMYNLPYYHSQYFPLFKRALKLLKRRRVATVLEVGCGVGSFAAMLFDRSRIQYSGFDFSEVAVTTAALRTQRPINFFRADATDAATYAHPYDAIVCTEVLEHIQEDRLVVSLWRSGTYCICSVPNFDSTTHVRVFRSEADVRERYDDLVNIDTIVRIKSRGLSDLSLGNYLRELRWNRYRPRRLRTILGLGNFDEGGWFLFSGIRR